VCTKPFKEAHFAVYPAEICVMPILSSCPPSGIAVDPMVGSGTTCAVAKALGRHYIGIDLNPEICRDCSETCATSNQTTNSDNHSKRSQPSSKSHIIEGYTLITKKSEGK